MEPFKKVVRIGTLPLLSVDGVGSTFCRIGWDGKRLYITGVEGPRHNGNCLGGYGQIVGHVSVTEYAPGWSSELLAKFTEVWNRWHLNNMRSSCEHQRDWPSSKQVEIVTWRLTTAAWQQQEKIMSDARKSLQAKGEAFVSPDEQGILNLPWELKREPTAGTVEEGRYKVEMRELKLLGYLREDEHPDGLLCRACPVCGYKYGTSWMYEPIPDDVLEFLSGLPDTDQQPAWI